MPVAEYDANAFNCAEYGVALGLSYEVPYSYCSPSVTLPRRREDGVRLTAAPWYEVEPLFRQSYHRIGG